MTYRPKVNDCGPNPAPEGSPYISNIALHLEQVVDYYPYGKVLREFKSGKEKYCYQGMHKDEELGENLFYTHFRQLDTDLGRWWRIDPVFKANWSPYVSMSNNPVLRIDPRGDDDYYDMNGKFIGSTSSGDAIRLIERSQYNEIVKKVDESKPEGVNDFVWNATKGMKLQKELSQVGVKVQVQSQEAQQALMDQLLAKHLNTGKEQGAFIILDVKNAKLYIQEDKGAKGTAKSIRFSNLTYSGDKKTIPGNSSLVVIADIHTHDTYGGPSTPENGAYGQNQNDLVFAQQENSTKYVKDLGGISKVTPDGRVVIEMPVTINTAIDALQEYGTR